MALLDGIADHLPHGDGLCRGLYDPDRALFVVATRYRLVCTSHSPVPYSLLVRRRVPSRRYHCLGRPCLRRLGRRTGLFVAIAEKQEMGNPGPVFFYAYRCCGGYVATLP